MVSTIFPPPAPSSHPLGKWQAMEEPPPLGKKELEAQNRTAPTPGGNFPQINVYVRMCILYHEHLHISKLLLKIIGAVSLKDASSVSLSVWPEELPATAQTLLLTAEMLLPRGIQ